MDRVATFWTSREEAAALAAGDLAVFEPRTRPTQRAWLDALIDVWAARLGRDVLVGRRRRSVIGTHEPTAGGSAVKLQVETTPDVIRTNEAALTPLQGPAGARLLLNRLTDLGHAREFVEESLPFIEAFDWPSFPDQVPAALDEVSSQLRNDLISCVRGEVEMYLLSTTQVVSSEDYMLTRESFERVVMGER